MDLNSLLLDFSGKTLAEIEAIGRSEYEHLYITSRNFGVHKAHDGEDVFFWKDRFEHAFFTSSNWASFPDRKDKLDVDRIKRLKWIGPVVSGLVSGTICREVPGPTGRRHPPNRLYLVTKGCYVVWLEPRMNGGWKFSSAYVARYDQLRRYCQGGKVIWRYGENNSPRD